MSRLVVVLWVLMLGLAGCTDNEDGQGTADDPGPPPSPNQDDAEDVPGAAFGVRPIWFAGLQYTYDVVISDADLAGPMTVTVLGAEGAFELTGNASEEIILWTLFHHLPPLGPVEPDTFNPVIHDTPVAWFDFPLRDGKTWSGPDHHGTTVNYTASATTVKVPTGRTVPAFEVVGERTGTTWVRYTYTAEVGWFTSIEVDGDGDGTPDAEMTMTQARVDPNHGRLMTFRPHGLAIHTAMGPESLPNEAATFTIESHHTEVFVYFVMFGGPGHYTGFVSLPGEPSAAPLPGAWSREYNWTNTEQSGSMLFGERVDPTPGEGSIGGIPLAQGGIYAEVMALERAPQG